MKLLLTLLALVSIPAHADDLAKKVRDLAAKSQKSGPACENASKAIEAILKGTEPGQPLKNKADALKLLEIVRNFPPVPKATREALRLISQAQWTTGHVTSDAGRAASKVYDCDRMRLFDAFRAVTASVRPLGLDPKLVAQAELRRTISELEGNNATLIETALYGALFTEMADAKVLSLSDPLYVELIHWNEQMMAARHASHGLPRDTMIGRELELTAPLNRVLVALAKRAS